MKTKLVVIGGGFAGTTVARKLEKLYDVTLVDRQDYFEFTPGVLRSIVDLHHLKSIQRLHKAYLKKTNFVFGEASDVSSKEVIVGNKKIPYDYLVIASGSRYESPLKEEKIVLAQRGILLQSHFEKLKRSKKVLVVGGGLAGVELTAEIITHYHDKEVHLVHAGEELIERNPPRARKYVKQFLEKRGAIIHFNEMIVENKGKNYFSAKKNVYTADIAFMCTGIFPNTSFLKKHFSKTLNQRGYVLVDPTLKVEGQKNIFAIGDVNSCSIEKTAQNANYQANLVVKNLLLLEKDKPLLEYHAKKTPMLISLGKYDGLFISGNFVMGGIIPAIMKWGVERKEMWKF